jgi:Ca2+-binding EF-hand superfamily protein
MFVEILTVFHISTSLEEKYKYLFRLYDWDKDFKLSIEDISKTIGLIQSKNSHKGVYGTGDLRNLAEKFINKYGDKGFITAERFREAVNED